MNPFVLATAVLYTCATAWSLYNSDWRMALIWSCYAASGFALAGVK